jgi:hypothetical protein
VLFCGSPGSSQTRSVRAAKAALRQQQWLRGRGGVIQLALTGITAALAHSIATDGDDTGVRALFNLSWVFDMMGALPIAAFVLAVSVGLRPTQMFPHWLSWGGIGVALLLALRSTTWRRDGVWSPTGEYLFIVIPLALLWILITSIVLVRSACLNDHAVSRISVDAVVGSLAQPARLELALFDPECDHMAGAVAMSRGSTRLMASPASAYGRMFWFRWNRLSGSYLRFTSVSRS